MPVFKHFLGFMSGYSVMKFIFDFSLSKNINFFGLFCTEKINKINTDDAKIWNLFMYL